jgi:hypothetical protein
VNIVSRVRIVAALLAALRWFMSARTMLTRVRAGLEELDKATQLADDLRMGKMERRKRGFCLHCGGGGCADRPLLKLTLFEPVRSGGIYIEKITSRSCTSSRGTPAEYKVGLLRAIENGWLELHKSGTFARFTETDSLLARATLR